MLRAATVAALPVADEPTPFWDGGDAAQVMGRWVGERVRDPEREGRFTAPNRLNGSSGRWVSDNVLATLGYDRSQAWITDCLDTYRLSAGVAARLADTYDHGCGERRWSPWSIRPHPWEAEIVTEATAAHLDRLRGELETCQPDQLVTLGNAALRVVARVFAQSLRRLSTDTYGVPIAVRLGSTSIEWLPLAHPAAPQRYQDAHEGWRKQRE